MATDVAKGMGSHAICACCKLALTAASIEVPEASAIDAVKYTVE